MKGVNVVITGASSGLGWLLAERLAVLGANLLLCARRQERLDELQKKLSNDANQILTISADVTLPEDRQKILERSRNLGRCDILVNNAGMEFAAPFEEIPEEDVQYMYNLNLIAPIELSRKFLTEMMDNRNGHIINIASLAGKSPFVYNSIYSSAKAGLILWTKAIREEYIDRGIKFTVICPGFVSGTGMHARRNHTAPFVAREVKSEKVVMSIIKAMKSNREEVIVTASPIRPLLALSELFPGLRAYIYRKLGVKKFMLESAEIEMARRVQKK
jgi:short-subunit dehydrogenase